MKHELWYSVVVRDRQGKVVSRERHRARSFLKAWNQMVYLHMSGTNLTIKDITGANFTATRNTLDFRMKPTPGIYCGEGDTPVTIEDYHLESLAALDVLAMTVSEAAIADSHCYFLVSRSFLNTTGVTITVKEVGIRVYVGKTGTPTSTVCMVIRDVLVTPQAIPDGGGITVDYTLEVVA